MSELNSQQKCAVTSPAAVLQVLAPPGSGKTKTLTARVAYLVANRGFKPWNIIVCTFTIKAAREMKERIRGLVGEHVEAKLHLGTFHSVARRFLVCYGQYIGIDKNFGIADTSDTTAILKRIIKRRSYGIEPSAARSRISGLKAKNISCEQHSASQKSVEQQEFSTLYTEYEETLKSSNLLDYDDLLLRCSELLRKRPECVSNIEAVLIDEFQDTNHIQYELMTLFGQKHKNITIVGDPDQSIYGFRSAEIKNLHRMQSAYRDTLVVLLEENYRSSAAILHSAVEIIEQDETRPPKRLLPTHSAGEQPVLRRLPSAAVEASWVVGEIQRSKLLTGHLFSYSDFAILLRSASLSRHIETALGKAGIPYRMVGGHRFFDRVEVKLVLDYLRVVNQPTHNDALVRIINVPSRKIGEVTVKSLLEEAEGEKISLWDLVLAVAQGHRRPKTKLSTQAQKGIEGFVNIILTSKRKLAEKADTSSSLVDLIGHLFRKLSFEEYLKKSYPEDFEGRWANVEELMAQAQDVSAALANGEPLEESLPEVEGLEQRELSATEEILNRFLANVALATDSQIGGIAAPVDQVTISTIHAAKGLEWPVVFIPAAYQGSIPHSRAEDTDEERRLLYVGMTRAQALLYLSCPLKTSQKEDTTLSPFLSQSRTQTLFATRGCKFGYSTTQDLSRILRRACPSEGSIATSRIGLEHTEDDQWPENGEDPRNRGDNLNSDIFYHSHYSSGPYPSYSTSEPKRAAAGILSATTMQQPHSFSVATATLTTGFVSANARMKEIQSQTQQDTAEKKKDLKRQAEPLPPLSRGSKKQTQGQGSITSFFGKGALEPKDLDLKALAKPVLPLSTQPSVRKSTLTTQRPTPTAHAARTNVVPAPPSFSNHKVRAVSNFVGKQRDISDVDDTRPTRHILLSSSPTKPDDDERQPVSAPVPLTYNSSHDARPATTFHTTSIAQLNNRVQGQRKTLGVRRSMQGWSAKAHQPFNVPGRQK